MTGRRNRIPEGSTKKIRVSALLTVKTCRKLDNIVDYSGLRTRTAVLKKSNRLV